MLEAQQHAEMALAIQAGLVQAFGDAARLAGLSHKEMLSGAEVEALFGYPVSTQEKDRKAGRGPSYVKKGKSVLYRRRDLDRYFASLRVKTRDQG